MALPFTSEQFFGVFAAYNETVWPAQFFLLALAALALMLVAFPRTWSGRAVSAILAVLWAWLALAYHLAFFASINPLAYVFAAVSAAGAQAAFLLGVWQNLGLLVAAAAGAVLISRSSAPAARAGELERRTSEQRTIVSPP